MCMLSCVRREAQTRQISKIEHRDSPQSGIGSGWIHCLLLTCVSVLCLQSNLFADDADELREIRSRLEALEQKGAKNPDLEQATNGVGRQTQGLANEPDLPGIPPLPTTDNSFFHSVNTPDSASGAWQNLLKSAEKASSDHGSSKKEKHWYEKYSFRGYVQTRYGRTIGYDQDLGEPQLLGDRGIGNHEGFTLRRARLVFSGDASDHVGIYIQPDFGVTPPGSTYETNFVQLRDCYSDISVDTDKVHRFRAGLSKVPYGFENMQSSQNRVTLDRSDPINSAVAPNERDLGVFYYWTPVEKQELLKELQNSTLKGSGNYGIFGLGVYNGEGGSVLDLNSSPHLVARLTWPWEVFDGQIAEVSLQGIKGMYVVQTTGISPNGMGPTITPSVNPDGVLEERICGSFIWYPQPWGFQSEWNVGNGPGLNSTQTAVVDRSLSGGYVMSMYRIETKRGGNLFPYARYWNYRGPYYSQKNAPFGLSESVDLGLQWQPLKEIQVTAEYSLVDRTNTTAINSANTLSYNNFQGHVIRFQLQWNF